MLVLVLVLVLLMLVSVTASAPVLVLVLVPVAVRGEIADAAVLESPPGRAGRSGGRGSQPERSAEAQRSHVRARGWGTMLHSVAGEWMSHHQWLRSLPAPPLPPGSDGICSGVRAQAGNEPPASLASPPLQH